MQTRAPNTRRLLPALLSTAQNDHNLNFLHGVFLVIYLRRFRGVCLLTLFREALSRAFAPSFCPVAETP